MPLNLLKHRISLSLAALLILCAGTIAFYPWTPLLESRLKSLLEGQGLQNVRLTLSDVGFHKLTVNNLAWGDKTKQHAPQALSQLTLDYSLWDLLLGHVQELNVSGLTMEAHQQGGAWSLAGLAAPENGAKQSVPLTLPVTEEQIASFPLERATLDNSRLLLTAEKWSMDIPLRIKGQKRPSPQLSLQTQGSKFKIKGLEIETGEISAEATLNPADTTDKTWNGSWTAKNVNASAGDTSIPILNGKGALTAKEDRIVLQGTFDSADSLTHTTFQLVYFVAEPQKSKLTLANSSFPWNGGVISAQDIVLPLGKPQPVNINLKLQSVSLDALLQQLTGKRASGDGMMSGILPITLGADGSIAVHEGTLSAEGPGIIRMSPETIPGDNPQLNNYRLTPVGSCSLR